MALDNKIIIVQDRETKKQTEKFVANYPKIRTLRGFLDGEWDLSLFSDCFKGRNALGDVDATLELNGHTLVVEFKGSRNGMNKGQVLKAIRQAKYSGIITYFVFGKKDNPEAYLKIEPSEDITGFIASEYTESDLEGIKQEFIKWAEYTEKYCLVTSKTEEWGMVNKVMTSLY